MVSFGGIVFAVLMEKPNDPRSTERVGDGETDKDVI